MTRYFYTDPLAAAYMAKHFGMRFYNYPHIVECLSKKLSSRFYMTYDDIKILNPRVHDILVNTGDYPFVVCNLKNEDFYENDISKHSARKHIKEDNWRIIQRQGKPFFWPEKEEES